MYVARLQQNILNLSVLFCPHTDITTSKKKKKASKAFFPPTQQQRKAIIPKFRTLLLNVLGPLNLEILFAYQKAYNKQQPHTQSC